MNSIRFSMLLAIGVAFGGYNYVSADVAAVAGAAQNLAKAAVDTGAEALGKLGAYEFLALNAIGDALKKVEKIALDHPKTSIAVVIALYLKIVDIASRGELSYKLKNKLRELKKAIGTDLGKVLVLLGFGAGVALGTDFKAIYTNAFRRISESFYKGAESVINA
jgi:hypothetical protein